jgi:hypothetical protein
MTAREHMINTLLDAGVDEAADYALPAMWQWLLWRASTSGPGACTATRSGLPRVANEPVS